MLKKYLVILAASLIALKTVAQPTFTQFIVFGDSLLDTGNRTDVGTGIKFTNQLLDGSGFAQIAPEYLADYIGVPIDAAVSGGTNYAVGGNKTLNILGTMTDPNLVLATPLDPSFKVGVVAGPQETIVGVPPYTDNATTGSTIVAAPYLATTGGVIDPGSLVMIDGGGNDIVAIALSGSDAATSTALVTASAQNFVASIGVLNAAGAKYIMVANVPDLGKVAFGQAAGVSEVATGSAASINSSVASSGLSALSAGYNSAVTTFATLRLPDANIIPVDLNGVVTYVLDNAEAYGLASGELDIGPGVPTPLPVLFDQRYMCYDGSSGQCIEHPVFGINGSAPNPRRLFFNDTLHPTEIASEIVGDYMIDILAAPMKVGLLPELALAAARTQVSVSGNELRHSRWGSTSGRLFISGDVSNNEYESNNAPEADSSSLTVGRTFVASDTLIYGIALTVGQQDLDITGADFDTDSWGVTGLLGYRQNGLFVDGLVGISALSYDDLQRDVKLGSQTLVAKGDTDGHAWTIDALAGIDVLSSDSWHLAPAVGIQYINTVVDSYTESGGAVSNYSWGEQRRKSMQWRYGLVASGELSQSIRLFAEAFGVSEQEDDSEELSIRNTHLNSFSYHLPSYQVDDDSFVTATVGGSLNIARQASFNLIYNYSNRGDGYEHIVLSYSMPM